MLKIDRDEIARLTETYGGPWGINHTRRLLRLVEIIGEGQSYNADVVWVAAHLHDWGGYPEWAQDGVHHALRSRQVAEPFLNERGIPEDFAALVLESIEFHHNCSPDHSIEAILLSDADALDFLGAVGVLRIFSKQAKNLRKAFDIVNQKKAAIPDTIILESSRKIAAVRLEQMEQILSTFEEETFGCF